MVEQEPRYSFDCEALPDGQVRMSITQSDEQIGEIEMPASKVADVVTALLSAVTAAGKLAGGATHPQSGGAL